MEEKNEIIDSQLWETNKDIRTQAIKQIVNSGVNKDYIMITFTIFLFIVGQFITHPIIKWGVILAGVISIIFPLLIRVFCNKRTFNLQSVVRTLEKAGFELVVDSDTVRWKSNGKENIVKLYDSCFLKVCREYSLMERDILEMNSKAAIYTTNQIHSVKVRVKRESEENGCLFFSVESLCPSSKVFNQVYSVFIQSLDIAEKRHLENLKKIATTQKLRRKIGFQYKSQ